MSMCVSLKLVRRLFDRCNPLHLVFACLVVSVLAGCEGQSTPKLGDDMSPSNETKGPREGLRRVSDDVDEFGEADGTIEVGTRVPEAAGGTGIVGNQGTASDIKVPRFYTVPAYDVQRDPAADLRMTITKAKQENKQILLQVGGDWCNWCGRLAEFMRERGSVRSLLEQHFLIMKVASQSRYAEEFLMDYPEINAYPFVYVLSSKGELLHSQDMEELELGEGYDEEAFVDFLQAWGASSADVSPDSSGMETK